LAIPISHCEQSTLSIKDLNDITIDSSHGFSGELGAGLVIPIRDNESFMPSACYHYLSRSLSIDGIEGNLDLSDLSYGASII
jgi:hypothetical protein